MTYVVDYTDADGKARTERLDVTLPPEHPEWTKTLIAYHLAKSHGGEIAHVDFIKEERT